MPGLYELISLSALLPEIILAVGACAVLLLGQVERENWRRYSPGLVLLTLFAAIAAVVIRARMGLDVDANDNFLSGSGLFLGSLAGFGRVSTLFLGVILTFVAWMQPQPNERGEFWSLLLCSLLGVMLTGAANDLLMLFIAIELVSIPTYVLVAISRRNVRALEAGTKYFYLGALAAAITAYGFSLLYGLGGSASLPAVAHNVSAALQSTNPVTLGVAATGVVLSLAGLMFKISAVPLHFYVADVYQGAASSISGLLGFVPKFAGFLAIFKIMAVTGHWQSPNATIFWLLWIVAAASMTIGNVLALMQTNVKRMLAYSGVAHSGYMLVGVLIGPMATEGKFVGDGTAAVCYYIVVYGLANLAAFAVLGLLRTRGQPCETIRDIAGLVRKHPGFALLMALAMLTLMGLPPTAGFWGKIGLFGGALADMIRNSSSLSRPLLVLVILGVLNSALAAAYYLRVVAAVLLYENDKPADVAPRETERFGALLCGIMLLVFAFKPALLLEPGRRATVSLRQQPGDQTVLVVPAAPEESATLTPHEPAPPLAAKTGDQVTGR